MSPIRAYEAIAFAIGFLLIIAAVSIKAYRLGETQTEARYQAKELAEQAAKDRALDAAAKAIAQINVTQQTIVQKVQHEVETKTVYRDCLIPSDGVRLLNDAIAGKAEPADSVGVQTAP